MHWKMMLAAAALATSGAAQAMPVQLFLTKAEALQRKGPLALFSGDYKLLMNQVKADFEQLRAERLAAQASGRSPAYCPPTAGVKLTNKDIMAAMQAVPPANRAATDTKDALRLFMARRFPCR